MVQDQQRERQRKQEPGARSQEQQDPGSSRSQDPDSSRSQDPGPSRSQGCHGQGAPGSRQARSRNQDWICNCNLCKTFPGRELGEDIEHDEPGRRRLRVLLTWNPPRTRSRSPLGTKQRCRSPSARRSNEEARCRDELWEATTPRSRSMSP